MSTGYLPQPTTTPPSLYLPTSANENRPQKRQRTQHAAPGGAVQDSSRVLAYVNTQGGTLNGNGSGNAGYGNVNGQKASNGGNSAAVQGKQSYLSPPVVHANVANARGNMPGRRNITTPAPTVSSGDTGGPGSSGGVEDVAFSSLRVREENSTEIFAVPLAIVNGWETLIPALRTTFGRTGDPKVMNSRGDTIARAMLPHFLRDGMLLLVSFPLNNNQGLNRSIQTPSTNLAPPSTSNGTTSDHITAIPGNNNNPPTPHSPPIPIATSPLPMYQAAPATTTPTPTAAVNTPTSSSPRPETPIYKLSRTIHSVPELWREWEKGLEPDKPSVLSLESAHGSKWRASQAERKFYSRRKVIIEEVRKLIDQGRREWDAVRLVDTWREGRSLDALSKTIVERRKSADPNGRKGKEQGGGGRGQQQQQQQQQQPQPQQQPQQHQQQQTQGMGHGW